MIKEYLKILCYSLSTFMGVYIIVDFFERIDMFIKHEAPAGTIVQYFLYKAPFIMYQMIPISVLLSTLLTIGIMSKNNEIMAMKSGGMSLYSIVAPLILMALFMTGFSFIGSEYVTPYTNMRVTGIKRSVKKDKVSRFLRERSIWYSGKNMIYNFDYFNAKKNKLYGITLFSFDDEFSLKRRIDAQTGLYKNGAWSLSDVTVRDFGYEDGKLLPKKTATFKEMTVAIPETPETLKEVRKKAEEMSYDELKVFIADLKEEGYEATEYEVDLHAKIAIPFVCVIMTIIGIPFALKRRRAGSLAVGIGLSLAIGILYWITLSFAISLGHAGVIPPAIAAWVSLFIFLMIGAYMFSTVRH